MTKAKESFGLQLYANPSKLKFNLRVATGEEFDVILRLDEKKMYLVNGEEKTYTEIEFDYVGKEKTEKPKDIDFNLEKGLDFTVDSLYVGEGAEKFFCRKFSRKEGRDKVELWFTGDTKIGRSYVGSMNKLARIKLVTKIPLFGDAMTIKTESRPQYRYKDLDYFPIPLKADIVSTMMKARIEWEAKKVSRASIKKEEFEVPAGYKEILPDEFIQHNMSIMNSVKSTQRKTTRPASRR